VCADLLALRGPGLDPAGVADLVAWGAPIGSRSLLVDVVRLRPFWAPEPPDTRPSALERGARADRLWSLLTDAVVAAGGGRIALSGGLDSRAIAAAAVGAGLDVDAGTFGDPDAVDLPVARAVAGVLGLRHAVHELDPDCALDHEARVWATSGGIGGPAFAPGAATDQPWSGISRLLSGTSADVLWGDTPLPSAPTERRLRRLGLGRPSTLEASAPPAPHWVPPAGRAAWINLWTRQAAVTWAGSASRRVHTPVFPVAWHEPLLRFCLALSEDDRRDRKLLRLALARHAPDLAALPTVHGPVHDLGRAMRSSERWRQELRQWSGDDVGLAQVGLVPAEVRRLVRSHGRGRDRSGLLSRLRALWRWSLEPTSDRQRPTDS
jgi:asparagine synthetase B (glutamine-hydrolysing)